MMKATLIGLLLVGMFQYSEAKPKKRTKIDFEDELIEGAAKKPDLMTTFGSKAFNFKKLIKLRKNFIPEMQRTAEELPRTGGQD